MNQVNLIVCGSLHPRLFGVVSQHKCHNSKKYCIEKKKKGSTCQKCQKHKKERSDSQPIDIFKHCFNLLLGIKWLYCSTKKEFFCTPYTSLTPKANLFKIPAPFPTQTKQYYAPLCQNESLPNKYLFGS